MSAVDGSVTGGGVAGRERFVDGSAVGGGAMCDINILFSYIRPKWAMEAAEFSSPLAVGQWCGGVVGAVGLLRIFLEIRGGDLNLCAKNTAVGRRRTTCMDD